MQVSFNSNFYLHGRNNYILIYMIVYIYIFFCFLFLLVQFIYNLWIAIVLLRTCDCSQVTELTVSIPHCIIYYIIITMTKHINIIVKRR